MISTFLQTVPGAEPVILEGVFPAPVARVYRAWTVPEQVMRWFGMKPGTLVAAEIDLRVGGAWRFVVADNENGRASVSGVYTSIEPQRLLSFTWRHVREAADGDREETPESAVSVRFVPEGAATRLHLRHEGIVRVEGRQGVGSGWDAAFRSLQDLLSLTS